MNTKRIRQLAAGLIATLAQAACTQSPQTERQAAEREATKARMTDGKALFEEKCRTVAGEKIYRKVENVEGLLLMKVRPQAGPREWADPMWPGAAFARETTGDGFITTFLAYEHAFGPALGETSAPPLTATTRGYINTDRRTGGLPGYRWVEVIDDKDGKRYRYVLIEKDVTRTSSILIGGDGRTYARRETVLDRWSSTKPMPRYGVTYEDHVIPEERAIGLASSTIKVLDLKTQEVLGELTRYAWSPGTPSSANPSPWLTAYRCPQRSWTGADARQFVDQVLIPAKEK